MTKLLNEVLPHQREDAVNSLAYEAEARVRDPVYGCVGAISFLQRQVHRLQKDLDAANADLIRLATTCNVNDDIPSSTPSSISMSPMPPTLPATAYYTDYNTWNTTPHDHHNINPAAPGVRPPGI